MRRRERRDQSEFSLSFLDVISCGFGAIILLLMITKTVEPIVLEDSPLDLEAVIAKLQEELFVIRGESRVLNRQMESQEEQVSTETQRIARLLQEISRLRADFQATESDGEEDTEIRGRMALARQSLTAEMLRLQSRAQAQTQASLIGGIPVDSEYIIFVIDTSGSMFQYAWPMMIRKVEETLQIYPDVKGIQVMNDMGDYMFKRYRDRWIEDTPARRRAILERLTGWNPFSNSSPVEGIQKAISTFWAADKKISIYVFGDEFTGRSIADVVDTIDRINRADAAGNRRVRIHAVGFPVQFAQPTALQTTGIRFATLMREVTRRNGGTFVALSEFQ